LFLIAYRDQYYNGDGKDREEIEKLGFKDLLCDHDRGIMEDVEERMCIIEVLYLKYAKNTANKIGI